LYSIFLKYKETNLYCSVCIECNRFDRESRKLAHARWIWGSADRPRYVFCTVIQ